MPVHINEVDTEVNAFDISALLTEDVLRVIARRTALEINKMQREKALQTLDTQITTQRRKAE